MDSIHLLNLKCRVCGAFEKTKRKYLEHMSKCRREDARLRQAKPTLRRFYSCVICKKKFSTHIKLENHTAVQHEQLSHRTVSRIMTQKVQAGGSLSRRRHGDTFPFRQIKAFKGYVSSYRHQCNRKIDSLNWYFVKYGAQIRRIIEDSLDQLKCVKCQLSVKVEFKRYLVESSTGEYVYEYQEKMVNSNMMNILNPHQSLNRFMELCVAKIENSVSIFETYGSGWQFSNVLGSDIRVAKFKPLLGGTWNQVPAKLRLKKATTNIRKKGNHCFKWAVLASLYKLKQNQKHSSSYERFQNLHNFDCVEYPVPLSSISTFEKENNIAVNVFQEHFKDGLTPIYISDLNYTDALTANLLLLTNKKTNASHYVAIRNLDRLLGKDNCKKRILCFSCLQRIRCCDSLCKNSDCDRKCKFNLHRISCKKFNFQKINMPPVGSKMTFENFSNQLKAGYVLYADIECLLKPLNSCDSSQSTIKEKLHIPTGFSYALVKSTGELVTYRVYRGKGAIEIFLQDCLKIAEKVLKIYSINVPIKITESEENEFQAAVDCHICNKEFECSGINRKCRDHDHLTGNNINIKVIMFTMLCFDAGKFRGASHQNCNLMFKQKQLLPVVVSYNNFL